MEFIAYIFIFAAHIRELFKIDLSKAAASTEEG
jgi:hypothetical protein